MYPPSLRGVKLGLLIKTTYEDRKNGLSGCAMLA